MSKSMISTLAAVLFERGLRDWNTAIAEVLLGDIPDQKKGGPGNPGPPCV